MVEGEAEVKLHSSQRSRKAKRLLVITIGYNMAGVTQLSIQIDPIVIDISLFSVTIGFVPSVAQDEEGRSHCLRLAYAAR